MDHINSENHIRKSKNQAQFDEIDLIINELDSAKRWKNIDMCQKNLTPSKLVLPKFVIMKDGKRIETITNYKIKYPDQ